jgi:hypothetical protein
MLYRKYRGRAGFLFVAVREAGHRNPELDFVRSAGRSAGQRRAALGRAANLVGLTIPCVLDTPDGRVMRAYKAFPRRLVVVDRRGRIALDLGIGLSWDWDLSRVARWLDDHSPGGD